MSASASPRIFTTNSCGSSLPRIISTSTLLLALLPLGMGVLQMFGLLGLMNIPLNAANMIAVPIILGVGVD